MNASGERYPNTFDSKKYLRSECSPILPVLNALVGL